MYLVPRTSYLKLSIILLHIHSMDRPRQAAPPQQWNCLVLLCAAGKWGRRKGGGGGGTDSRISVSTRWAAGRSPAPHSAFTRQFHVHSLGTWPLAAMSAITRRTLRRGGLHQGRRGQGRPRRRRGPVLAESAAGQRGIDSEPSDLAPGRGDPAPAGRAGCEACTPIRPASASIAPAPSCTASTSTPLPGDAAVATGASPHLVVIIHVCLDVLLLPVPCENLDRREQQHP